MKKKISIILPNLGGGGAEKNYLMLANDWSQKGYTVEFVLLQKEGVFIKKLKKEILIYNLKVLKYRYSFFPILKFLINSKSDVIIVNLWPLTSIALIINILLFKKHNIIVHDHQILSKSYSKIFNNYRWYLSLSIKLIYPFSSGIIAVSNSVKKDLIKLGIKKELIKVINNPIQAPLPITKSNKADIFSMWGSNAKYKILSIGSLKYEKNFLNLINAFSLIKNKSNIKIAILGEGSEKEILNKEIEKLNLRKNIIMPGFIENLNKWYASADIYIITSIHEGFGNVVVEALSHGLPIIATRCGGPEEILENGKYGDLCIINNPKILSELILSNIQNLNKRKKEDLINRAKDFELKIISNMYIKYIDKILTM